MNFDATRRDTLRGLTTAGIALSAGCSGLPVDVPGFGNFEPPAFEQGWVAAREDGSADVVLAFAGNIQEQLEKSDYTARDIVGALKEEGINFRRTDVTVTGTENFADTQTVEGVFENFATKDVWGEIPWYKTAYISLLDSVEPTESASILVRFPSGYEYVLPQDHERILNLEYEGIEVTREYSGLFNYVGPDGKRHDPQVTFPYMFHFDAPQLVWLRASAEYRYQTIHRSKQLFSQETYNQNAYQQVTEGASEIATVLGQEAIESVLTSPLPTGAVSTGVSGVSDMKSVHGALTEEFGRFRDGLDAIERQAGAAMNNGWLAALRPDDNPSRDDKGLAHLEFLSEALWKFRNPLLATRYDTDGFTRHINQYERNLSEQETIISKILTDSTFSELRPTGGSYWENLYRFARNLLRKHQQLIQKERDGMASLKDSIS